MATPTNFCSDPPPARSSPSTGQPKSATTNSIPLPSTMPRPRASFVPVLVDPFCHAGDAFSVTSNIKTTPGHLYRVCLSGTVNLTTGPAEPSDIAHVDGIQVPASDCVVIEGDGKVIVVTCGTGEAEEEAGGFSIQVYDLGPS